MFAVNVEPIVDNVSIWLIEDHDDFRKMVAWQVNQLAGCRCSRQFRTCEEALVALEGSPRPQIILCDIGLPGMDGISGIRKSKRCFLKLMSSCSWCMMIMTRCSTQSVQERPANVTVGSSNSPPLIRSVHVTNGVAAVTWSAVSARTYRLQWRTGQNTNWNDVVPDVLATGSTAAATNVLSGSIQRFYRVALQP